MSRCRQQILQLEKQISETQDKIEAEQKRAVVRLFTFLLRKCIEHLIFFTHPLLSLEISTVS